ncbi:hypothetical protein M9458_016559, partial [Cirrhinus mrigala]
NSVMIWDQIQTAKCNKLDLHIVWLDLANAYGSVPHHLIRFALNFFHIPPCIQSLITNYFDKLQPWDVPSLPYSSQQLLRGVRSPSGQRLPALRSYMDDVTILLRTAACTNRLLKSLEDLITWARMKIKPSKKEPGRTTSPSQLYTAELSDKHMAISVTTQLTSGLKKIDESLLPAKFKVWCYQFTLFHRLLWPLKLCDITSSTVLKMDAKANNYIRKWLGLPRCLSTSALFGKNILRLLMKTISLGYKLEKVRLLLELKDSPDPVVRTANAQVHTGRKWDAPQAVHVTRLKHQEVVGLIQHGRAGFGWATSAKMWSKATKEVKKEEEESYRIKAVSQCQQGKWTTWEAVIGRTITWADLLSFLIRATYDTLPSPQNLHCWYATEELCQLCGHQSPSLQHIFSGCKTALTQGRYGWRHDRVLR